MPLDPALRLRSIDWSALEGLATPICEAARAVYEGKRVDHQLTELLRANPGFTSAQRTCVAEALFGLSIWRRRLAANVGLQWTDDTTNVNLSDHLPALFCSFLRDLAGLPEATAIALSGAQSSPAHHASHAPADLHSLPDWLWRELTDAFSADEAGQLAAALDLPGPIFLRANRKNGSRDQLIEALRREDIETVPCAFAPDGVRVTSPRPNLWASPAARAGWFEVQDEGSQLVGALLEARIGERVLDLCAGSGGKSLQLADAVGSAGRVLCFDIDREALARLRNRARRAGATQVEILESLPPDLRVDRALVDAPCSALGPLRRGPDARFRISPDSFAALPALQLELLQTAARHLHPGGRLVYATCTFREQENEAVAIAFEQAWPGFARIRAARGAIGDRFFRGDFFTSLPHRDGTDGFFAAAWEQR
jgi:16S rRNA (cytosine967-C5)-methyltransferase